MSRITVALLVIGLIALGGAQTALASGHGGYNGENPCFLDLLPEESRTRVEHMLSEFRAAMATLRERIAELRGTPDRDQMSDLHVARWELKTQVREDIAALLPEEYQEQFRGRAYGRHRHFQPESHPAGDH